METKPVDLKLIVNDWFDLRDADWQNLSPIDMVVQFYTYANDRIIANSSGMSSDDLADLYERAATPPHSDRSASPGAQPPSDLKDRAIEHAGYLASAAQAYLDERNRYDMAVAGLADEDSEVANMDSLADHHQALRVAIYEFRKRAERTSAVAPGTSKEKSCE